MVLNSWIFSWHVNNLKCFTVSNRLKNHKVWRGNNAKWRCCLFNIYIVTIKYNFKESISRKNLLLFCYSLLRNCKSSAKWSMLTGRSPFYCLYWEVFKLVNCIDLNFTLSYKVIRPNLQTRNTVFSSVASTVLEKFVDLFYIRYLMKRDSLYIIKDKAVPVTGREAP
jgi:cellulose synthase/poly-beta-1,6-N-acetylglucosamine synthase-like glycosyltransferase